jgi:hypothetical protein
MVEAIRTGKRAKAALAVASLVGLGSAAANAATITSASVNFNNGATSVPCIVEGRSELRNVGRVNCKTLTRFTGCEHHTYRT